VTVKLASANRISRLEYIDQGKNASPGWGGGGEAHAQDERTIDWGEDSDLLLLKKEKRQTGSGGWVVVLKTLREREENITGELRGDFVPRGGRGAKLMKKSRQNKEREGAILGKQSVGVLSSVKEGAGVIK